MKIWFRLVEALKSYRSEKPNDTRTRTRTKIFKWSSVESSGTQVLKHITDNYTFTASAASKALDAAYDACE